MNPIELLIEDSRQSLHDLPLKQLEGKTVLVTGASGIIGTQIIYGIQYIQQNMGINTRLIATLHSQKPKHLEVISQSGEAEWITGDLTERRFLDGLPQADIIIHAATYGQPGLFMEFPLETIRLNTEATLTLLDKVKPGGKFLFLSSSELYSGLSSAPFSEEQIGCTTPSHPRACYIEAKRCGETICNVYRSRGVDAKSARVCLAYGPGTRPDDKRVINNIIEKALRTGEIHLMDSGAAIRTYCYISDAVHMLWKILLEGKREVYNVGGVSNITIAGLAQLAGKIMNVPVVIPKDDGASLAGSPLDVQLDLNRFNREFGEMRFVELEEGLGRTIKWYQSYDEMINYINRKK